jgi:ABC-type transport system involved in cytochrome bd biosynthesis fused ATPase/permease subunit
MTLFIILYLTSFLRTIFILLVLYYGVKFFMRFMAPKMVEKAADKIYKDMKEKESQMKRKTTRRGDVTIDYTDKKPKQYPRNEGDYIEFEEIKDKKK